MCVTCYRLHKPSLAHIDHKGRQKNRRDTRKLSGPNCCVNDIFNDRESDTHI